jgi:hypothetical protein
MKEAELSQFIYRFLILNGSVNLPGLGSLEVLHFPAINDLNKQQISSPSSVIKFRYDEFLSESIDLIKYLVRHLNISDRNAFEKLSVFCAEIKTEIESGSEVIWRGLGKFSKSSDGFYVFENQHPDNSFDEEVANGASTNISDEFHTADIDEFDSVEQESDKDQSTFFVNFKTAVILLISIILLFFVIRYSFNGFDILGSRYEKLHPINPPSTYKENIK